MSKRVEWGTIHGSGDIVCECDQCGHEREIPFEDHDIDYKRAQEIIKGEGWLARKINGEWYDFCSERCYYNWIKENM